MSVPYFDLARAARRIAPELEERWAAVMERTAFVGGPEVTAFEEAFAAYLETPACVGVANGTDALVLALRAVDLEPGDEVIVPAFTFVATASAVCLAGGRPVFADVEPETLNLDIVDAGRRVTERTVGVVGVHLYGRPFDVEGAQALCRRHGLWLMEDAAQAHGARFAGRRVGSFGRLATWSFYPSKNLGCFGDGGAVTGGDADLLARVRRLANHGRAEHYHHVEVGTNSRLDALQAAVLNCRLPRLEEDNQRRREIACHYHGGLADLPGLELLSDPEGVLSVYHQMTVRVPARRDALRAFLGERGVGTGVHYPEALHLQPALEPASGDPPSLPVAEAAGGDVLCLPMFPELEDREVDEVIAAIRAFWEAAG